MFVAVLLSLVAFAFAADPSDKSTFHDTHSMLWKDCGDQHSWIKLQKMDLTPSPLVIPGHGSLTLHARNGNHDINQNVVLDVQIKKRLLNIWTNIPCTGDLGTCRYDDPCHFMQVLFPGGKCPAEFTNNGLPCTCPFTIGPGKSISLNSDGIDFASGNGKYSWLTTGEFYLKLVLYERGKTVQRMCLEFYLNLKA